ncbi:MAG: hypothetical protein IJW49_06355 [Clostridia bacterium]|nr:hypothetical protein [Clostridia bacterium]
MVNRMLLSTGVFHRRESTQFCKKHLKNTKKGEKEHLFRLLVAFPQSFSQPCGKLSRLPVETRTEQKHKFF